MKWWVYMTISRVVVEDPRFFSTLLRFFEEWRSLLHSPSQHFNQAEVWNHSQSFLFIYFFLSQLFGYTGRCICSFWIIVLLHYSVLAELFMVETHHSLVVSTAASQQEGPGFDPQFGPGGLSVCSPCVWVGFLQVLCFPPTVQKR